MNAIGSQMRHSAVHWSMPAHFLEIMEDCWSQTIANTQHVRTKNDNLLHWKPILPARLSQQADSKTLCVSFLTTERQAIIVRVSS